MSAIQFVDVEGALVTWLQGQFPAARVCTETPANLGDVVPVIRVERIGSTATPPLLDTAIGYVDVFVGTRGAARALAVAGQSAFLGVLPGSDLAGGSVPTSGVTQQSGPAWRPYDDSAVRLVGSTYGVVVRCRPQ